MSRIYRHPQPRFTGYRVHHEKDQKDATLFLPGYANLPGKKDDKDQFVASNVKAEVIKPGQSTPEAIELVRKGDYWESAKDVPLGTDYRFRVDYNSNTLPPGSVVATPLKDGQLDKKAGDSQPSLTDHKNGIWEFDNPLPTSKEMQLTVPVKYSPLPWRLERIDKGADPVGLPMKQVGENWVFTDLDAAADSTYRLSPALDLQEVRQQGNYGSFNRVSKLEETAPQKSPMLLDNFQDSNLTIAQLKELEGKRRTTVPEGAHLPDFPMRGPHNSFAFAPERLGLDPQNGKAEDGLKEMVSIGYQAGARGLLLKPSIGGDTKSSHGYWTEDGYVLNRSFSSKDAFRDMAGMLTGLDTKLVADGAFVNMGLSGVHQAANRAYGLASPYWRWFKYGDEHAKGGPSTYPSIAHGKPVNGVLPETVNEFGHKVLDKEYLGIRVINDPKSHQIPYDDKRPTYIQLFDTRLEKEDGTAITNADPKILEGSQTVQPYAFEINPKELKDGKPNIDSLLEWSNFRLGLRSEDNAGAKWDGQIDTALLNTRNPEVVNYLKGAVTYWTRFVKNTNVRNVTQAMLQQQAEIAKVDPERAKNLTPAEFIKGVTQTQHEVDDIKKNKNIQAYELLNDGGAFRTLLKHKPLPPATDAEKKALSSEKLQKIYNNVTPDHAESGNGQAFAKRLLNEVPMNVLPLPTLFKADLSYPGLEKSLSTANRGKFAQFMSETVLGNLARIPVLGQIFQGIRNAIFPRAFQAQLGDKMQDIFQQLNPNLQEKLRYGNVQSLLADKVGEVLYLSLFTGLQPDDVQGLMKDPKALEAAFYKGMPAHILKSDPVTASKFIPALLSKRLKELSPKQMGQLVEAEVSQLDPHMAAVAEAVLNQRELGLNWRIDAAKDVADMNRIKESPDHERAKIFEEEFDYVMNFWGKLTGGIREIFPKTTIIPELTDLELLSGADRSGETDTTGDMAKKGRAALKRVQQKFFESGVFNGTPNMRHIFSNINQLVHYATDPTQFGHSQIDSSKFMDMMREYVESLPAPVTRQMQNMVSSHDFATSSHTKLINSQLFHMDRESSRGLKEDLTVAIDELQKKVCFQPERDKLEELLKKNGVTLNDAFQKLWDRLESSDLKASLTDKDLQAFFDKATKTAPGSASKRPTPFKYKAKFVEQFFKQSGNFGLTKDQSDAFKGYLTARITEPSEAKAMRGALVNATEEFLKDPKVNGKDVKQELDLSAEDAKQLRNVLWDALNQVTKDPKEGRHFGYQPPDQALKHVFEQINPADLPESLRNNPQKLEQIKLGLYQTPIRQVMDKLQREFAIQMALPGMPSIYTPDLLAQGGAELTNNIFLQNRNIHRTDKLAKDTQDDEFKAYFDQVKDLTSARTHKDLQALSNGDILPVTPDDNSGILPIVRDNGQQQVITLVNVGTMPKIESDDEKKERKKTGQDQPLQPLDWLHKAGKGETYAMPERIRKEAKDLGSEDVNKRYQPNLKELGLNNGTTYLDVHTQKRYEVTDNRLHPAGNDKAGIPVNNWMMLAREPKQSAGNAETQ